ncbi:MAG: oligosaccharide flippase family protein [Chloroflexi bacterium]|nr:oligosaccharide flippase family protein [Chloroflexota bacterium]MCI0647995.1 oligosaccharide flippase family protein [Chloroflexota bacterium]MCI0727398.1 oligosaccharide flippase family protein [Chloroflexota bacterium]
MHELPLYRFVSLRLRGLLDPVSRGWAIILGSNLARMVLGFVASVLIARSLGLAGFGVYAGLGAVVNVTHAFSDLGLSATAVKQMAAVWPADPALAYRRGRVFFWLRLSIAGFIVAVGTLLAGPLAGWLNIAQGGRLLPLAFLGVLATAMSGTVSALFQATGRFGQIAALTIGNTALTVVLAIVLVATGRLTLVTALLVLGAGTALATFALGLRLLPAGWSLALPSRQELREEGRPLLGFARWIWVATTLATITAHLDVLLLTRFDALTTVGAYGLALNLANKVDVVNHSLFTVLLPAASALAGREAIGRYVRRGLGRSTVVALLLLALLPLSRPFILLFYGPAYALAVPLFQLLLGIVIFDVLTLPLLMLAYPLEQPRVLAMAEAARLAVMAALAAWLLPAYGPVGVVAAKLIAKAVGVSFVVALLLRRYRDGAWGAPAGQQDSPQQQATVELGIGQQGPQPAGQPGRAVGEIGRHEQDGGGQQ